MSRRVPLRHRTAATALAAVTVLVSVHLYTGALGGSVSRTPVEVEVRLATTGGLFEGSGVTYRGVRVGRVEQVRPDGDGVRATLSLHPSTRVPADTLAAVRSLSPAGEQFLDLQPQDGDGPYLADGDVVEADSTAVPTTVAEALAAVEDLTGQVDEESLRTTVRELGAAFQDPDDLGRVLESTSTIVTRLDAIWSETEELLTDGRTVLRTGVAMEDDLRTFASSAQELAAHLAERDDELAGYLRDVPGDVEQVRELVSLAAVALPGVLREMIGFTDMTLPREEHLRELLRIFPVGFDRFTGAVEGGRLQATMLIAPGLVCSYGVEVPVPTDPTRRPLATDRACPDGFEGQVRGSSNAPPPEPR